MPKMTDMDLKALLQAERSASLGGLLASDLSAGGSRPASEQHRAIEQARSPARGVALCWTLVSMVCESVKPLISSPVNAVNLTQHGHLLGVQWSMGRRLRSQCLKSVDV